MQEQHQIQDIDENKEDSFNVNEWSVKVKVIVEVKESFYPDFSPIR
jgi:hypothetical protein